MAKPILVWILGPPAVGKMATGLELEARTGLRLFHNHQTIELVLPYFEFGTPPFIRLVELIRTRIFEEVAASELPGLVFTYTMAFDLASEHAYIEKMSNIFRAVNGTVYHIELFATQEERLRRNESPERLAAKPSKRDIEASRRRLLEHDFQYRFNSEGEFDGRDDYLKIDNTRLAPATVADLVVERFGLPRPALPSPR